MHCLFPRTNFLTLVVVVVVWFLPVAFQSISLLNVEVTINLDNTKYTVSHFVSRGRSL